MRASATPKNTANTISASISPVSASTAAASGFLGMRESRVSAHVFAFCAFSIVVCDWAA
jgi:hypothetical protein